MAEYFRTVFSVRKPDVFGIELLREVEDVVEAWGMDCFGPCKFDSSRREWVGGSGALRIRRRKLPDDRLGAFRLVWERPDTDDPVNRWRLSARLATDGLDVEADIEVLGIETPNRPLREEYLAELPTAPSKLLDEFECWIGEIRLTTAATEVASDQSATFIDDYLFNLERKIPLIVVSRNKSEEGIDADRLQERLVGLAEVVSYDHDTAWEISKELPRALRCYDGAIRLYPPGCSEHDVSQQNPYWMPSDEYELREYPNRFWMMLRDECVSRTPTHTRRRLFASALNRINTMRLNQRGVEMEEEEVYYRKRRSELESNLQSTIELEAEHRRRIQELDSAYDDILRELDDDAPDVSAAKTVARTFKNKNAMLEEEIRRLNREIGVLKAGRIESSPDRMNELKEDCLEEPREAAPQTVGFNRVIDAVNKANHALDTLRFLPAAFSSADRSQFRRPQDVYRALVALDTCGKARRQGGRLGVDIADWMTAHGVDYAAHEGERTEAQFGNERTFHDTERDEEVFMPAHIKIGGNELRIHVLWKDDERKWLVGWVGDHLPTAMHNS